MNRRLNHLAFLSLLLFILGITRCLADGGLSITNTTSDSLIVVAVGADDSLTPVVELPPESIITHDLPAGTKIGFAKDGQWVGDGYVVTGASNESVSVPYASAAAPGKSAEPETPQADAVVPNSEPSGVPLLLSNTRNHAVLVVTDVDGKPTVLFQLEEGEEASKKVPAGVALAFYNADTQTGVGEPYTVTGVEDESVAIPYFAANEARARQMGEGSVSIKFSNTLDVPVSVVTDEGGSGVIQFELRSKLSSRHSLLPGTTVWFYNASTGDEIKDPLTVGNDGPAEISVPYSAPAQVAGKEPEAGSMKVVLANTTDKTVLAVTVKNGDANATPELLAEVPPSAQADAYALPGATLFFYDKESQQALPGMGYRVKQADGQSVSIPYDPATAFRAKVLGGDAPWVTIGQGADFSVTVAAQDEDGNLIDLFEIPSQKRDAKQIKAGTELWFYKTGTNEPVGDSYTVTGYMDPVLGGMEFLPIPYKIPSVGQASQRGPGTTILNFASRTGQVLTVLLEQNDQSFELYDVQPMALQSQTARPGSKLWFVIKGTTNVVGSPYVVKGTANEMVSVPYEAPDDPLTSERAPYVGKGSVSVEFINSSTDPLRVATRDESGKKVRLFDISAGMNVVQGVKPGTMLWFYIASTEQAFRNDTDKYLGKKLPYMVTDAPDQRIILPYSPSDSELEKLFGLDLNKITAETAKRLSAKKKDEDKPSACWKDTKTRGVGSLPYLCPDGTEESTAGLCYDKCKPGYSSFVTMCVPDCPAGWRNDGLHCFKPAPYERDAYPVSFEEVMSFGWLTGEGSLQGARDRCKAAHGDNCVTANGDTIVYETCKAGYHQAPLITSLCSPDCPANTTDIGISCQKDTYDRGVGGLMSCEPGKDSDAGLCYDQCPARYDGVGPVCWTKCPKGLPFNCGATCTTDESACIQATSDQVFSPLLAAANIALTVVSVGTSTGGQVAGKVAQNAAKVGAEATGKTLGKQALKQVSKEAAKQLAKQGFKQQLKTALTLGAKTALKTGGKILLKEVVEDTVMSLGVMGIIEGSTYLASKPWQRDWRKEKTVGDQVKDEVAEIVRRRLGQAISDDKLDTIVDTAFAAAEADPDPAYEFPWEALDPTGIADIVIAYNLPMCSDVPEE